MTPRLRTCAAVYAVRGLAGGAGLLAAYAVQVMLLGNTPLNDSGYAWDIFLPVTLLLLTAALAPLRAETDRILRGDLRPFRDRRCRLHFWGQAVLTDVRRLLRLTAWVLLPLFLLYLARTVWLLMPQDGEGILYLLTAAHLFAASALLFVYICNKGGRRREQGGRNAN